jgi:hypothetical protein
MLLVSKVLSTDGSGYWSNRSAKVPVVGLDLAYETDTANFGELRVYFDTDVWAVEDHGPIYTDNQFLKELLSMLNDLRLGTDVSYSEQGMQGEDYVSLDVGPEFIRSFKALKA